VQLNTRHNQHIPPVPVRVCFILGFVCINATINKPDLRDEKDPKLSDFLLYFARYTDECNDLTELFSTLAPRQPSIRRVVWLWKCPPRSR